MEKQPGFIEIKKLAELIYDVNSVHPGVKYSSGQLRTIRYWRETFPYIGLYVPRQELLDKIAYYTPGENYQFDEIRILRINDEATYYAALKLEEQAKNLWTYEIIVATKNITLHTSNDPDALYSVNKILKDPTEFGPVMFEFELPNDRNYLKT